MEQMTFEEKKLLAGEIDFQFARWMKVNRIIDRILLGIILLVVLFVGSALMDNLKFLDKGINGVAYHDFNELLAINPDTVAWITMQGTHIDHPVVKGKDNFEYLEKGFDGKYYAGGTLFLDCNNNKEFKDAYNIIHGHHMAKGAMFGDLDKYQNPAFFKEHRWGVLLTPKYDYDLRVVAVGTFDAYDGAIYGVGDHIPYAEIFRGCSYQRAVKHKDSQILALSTCAGSMDNDRTVVFCEMLNKHRHE